MMKKYILVILSILISASFIHAGTLEEENAKIMQMVSEAESNGDDSTCDESRQLLADGITAYIEEHPDITSINNQIIQKLVKRAGRTKEDRENQGILSRVVNGRKMYKNRIAKLWIEPLISTRLCCPQGGSYGLRQNGRRIYITCSKHTARMSL